MYDPSYFEDENVPVPCFFTDQIDLAYRSHVSKIVSWKEKATHPTSRQCSQASKCIILSFFCKFGYQIETFRNYYLALKKYKNAWRQKFWTLKSRKSGFTLGRVSCSQKIQFCRIFTNFTQFESHF